MEVQEIELFIDRNGEVRIEVRGVKGKGCLELTKELEEALRGEIVARDMTSEAYATVQEEVANYQQLKDG